MAEFNFAEAFYNSFSSNSNFIGELASLQSSKSFPICLVPFYTNESLNELFLIKPSNCEKIKLFRSNGSVFAYEIIPKNNIKNHDSFDKAIFFIYKMDPNKNIYVLISLEKGPIFEKVIKPLIKRNSPNIITTFISHNEFYSLLRTFKEKHNFTDIEIKKTSQSIRYEENGIKKIISGLEWPNLSIDGAFEWIKEKNGWFKSLRFHPKYYNNSLADIYISRQGIVKTNAMFIDVFNEIVIPIINMLEEKVKKFSNRSRRENNFDVKPLLIEFDEEKFADIDENKLFIDSIRNYKNSSISILHGNPYVHLSIIDYFDGSNFDIWVLNSSSITIVPQLKGSAFALKRLVNHIYDSYGEGEIKEYQE